MNTTMAPRTYDTPTLHTLNRLTCELYAREAASFSATRQAPWRGWGRALDIVSHADPSFLSRPIALLDLACGNLRFERFLAERGAELSVAHALDNCTALTLNPDSTEALGAVAGRLDFRQVDLAATLIDCGTLDDLLPLNRCDLSVAFGFMHHLAEPAHRVATLSSLVRAVRPGGFVVVSFWQPLNDPRIAAKAPAVTAEGRAAHGLPPFAPGDFLLGWQQSEGVYRFCHHTTDDEIDRLLADAAPFPMAGDTPASSPTVRAAVGTTPLPSPSFREVARFSADGKQGNLNRYVVLRRY